MCTKEKGIKKKAKSINLYEILVKYNGFVIFTMVVLTGCVIADILPCRYFSLFIERIFTRKKEEYTVLLSIILVVWTATISLIVFLGTRFEDKHYGIKIIHIMNEKYEKHNFVMIIGMFLFQLVLMIFSNLCLWPITITVLGFMQMLILVFIFVVICKETSEANIDEVIIESSVETIQVISKKIRSINVEIERGEGDECQLEKEKKELLNEKLHENMLMHKVIRYIDYKDVSEVNKLFEYYVKIAISTKEECTNVLEKYIEYSIDYFFEVCSEKELVERVIKNLIIRCGQTEIIRGVFASIMKNIQKEHVPYSMDVFRRGFENKNEVMHWAVAYNSFYSMANGQKFRKTIAKAIRKEITNMDENIILYEWKRLFSDHNMGQKRIVPVECQKNYIEKYENERRKEYDCSLRELFEVIYE